VSLDWPAGFDRTPSQDQRSYPGGFRVTRSAAFENILDEVRKWDGITDVQIESGIDHYAKKPNIPHKSGDFDDPGVVLRFTKDGEQMAAACDRWDNPRDNAQDLYHYLHETRMQEQRGTVTAQSEYEKLRLPPRTGEEAGGREPPHEILRVNPDADRDEIKRAARELKKEHHPDRGGELSQFKRINRAERELLEGSA